MLDNLVVPADYVKTDTGVYQVKYSGFHENTLYQIKGMAFNKEGESGWSEAISVKTTIGAPKDFAFLVVSNDKIFLSWVSPQGMVWYKIRGSWVIFLYS